MWAVRRPILAVTTAVALVVPVVALGAVVHDTIASDVAARSAAERVQDAQLSSRLIADDLVQAGELATYLSGRSEVVAALRARDATALARELGAAAAVWQYPSILGLDPRGFELAVGAAAGPAQGIVTGSDRSDRDYFSGALTSRVPFVSEAYRSAGPDQPTLVAVSMAVRDGGTLLGVVAVTIAPRELITEPEMAAGVAGREVLIVDKRSHVVASTSAAHLPLSEVRLPSLDAALGGRTGSSPAPLSGTDRVVTYVPVPGAAWVLYVVDDPSVVLAVERDLQDRLGVAASAALLATLILAGGMIVLYAALSKRSEELATSRAALLASNAALADADRRKTEFLSTVSDELRTPMNAVLGFADLLEEELRSTPAEKPRRYAAEIRGASEHLRRVIDDILDLARVETGRIDVRPEVLTVEQLVEPVVANGRRSAADGRVAFTASVAAAEVRLDPVEIRQVLYNLVSNALKFTPAGGHVAFRARVEGGDLVLEVSDTGIGIPLDRHARVFGMFERVNEDRSGARGTGVGLALSKRIVELHGGAIGFDSIPDHGSTFWVRLPGVVRRRESAPAERPVAHRRASDVEPAGT